MGLFSKRKKDDFFEVQLDDGQATEHYENAPSPSHLLTADEIISNFGDGKMTDTVHFEKSESPLEHMRQKMLDNAAKREHTKEEVVPAAPPIKSEAEPELKKSTPSAIDFMSLFASPQQDNTKIEPALGAKPAQDTLIDKLTPYIVDDEGHNVTEINEPIYRLQSVADILKSESDRAIEDLSKAYDITFDDLGKKQPPAVEIPEPQITPEPPPEEPAAEEETADNDFDEALIFDEILPNISDIDTKTAPREIPDAMSQTATIRFTPVKAGDSSEHISVSTTTRPIDLTGEFSELTLEGAAAIEETHLEDTEFEAFEVEKDIVNEGNVKQLVRRLAILKRRAFLQSIFSGLLLVGLLLFLLPSLSGFIIANPKLGIGICSGIFAAMLLVNIDAAASIKTMLSLRAEPDSIAFVSALAILASGIIAAINGENIHELLAAGGVILFSRALYRFRELSAKLSSLKRATAGKAIKATSLITDEATSFAMAKSAIEGDALIAAARTTDRADDFMKYYDYSPALSGRMRIINISALCLAAVMALSALAIFSTALSAVYSAAIVLSLAATPSLFILCSLPLYSAANRMGKKGAYIAGLAAAERLNLANAAVFSSTDLFPEGTVTMGDMKVLSDNNFDENILRAASLTEAVGSPLASIFKKIAGTNSDYKIPDSDTVKYEDKLGLSGWVGDELVFIGNRTLMQAHGIAVPDVEVDRKILRRGYFPVYLACSGKACALILVQYNVEPDVVFELRRLTNLGVTLLINNCDPNITEEMICDYIGLYSDSVKIMSNSGVHMYKNATMPAEHCSAPAAFRGRSLNLAAVLTCASRIVSSNRILTAFYYIAICFLTVIFAYLSFLGGGDYPVSAMTVFLSHLIATAIAYILYLLRKP